MRIRSHLDPTLFVIFLHVDTRGYDDDFRALARSLQATRGTDIGPLFDALKERERRILAHERYHFWQGLRLPFLHVYALVTLRGTLLGARHLAAVESDWRGWSQIGARASIFDRLDMPYHLAGKPSGELAFGAQTTPGYDLNLVITAKQMLEYAASIFDFQGSCETIAQMSDPQAFHRWRKRNPAYLEVHDFLRDFFRSERLVLRMGLPMVNAAFHTSIPERALTELAARIWGNFVAPGAAGAAFLSQPEPCRWPEVFQLWLKELPYEIPFGSTPDNVDLVETPFYYMDPNTWLGSEIGGGIQHPFLGPAANEWQNQIEDTLGLGDYIDMPGYVANESAHRFAWGMDPQIRVVRVFFEDGSDKVFAIGDGLVGPAFKDPIFSRLSASEFRGFILDTMAVYGVMRRAFGFHMAEAAQTCHHVACPHHSESFCNAYPLIPESFERCGFPARMKNWVKANRSST